MVRFLSAYQNLFVLLLLLCLTGIDADAEDKAVQRGDATAQSNDGNSLRVMTFNIRYLNNHDGANHWKHRRDAVCDIVTAERIDIVGMQEVVLAQKEDMDKRLPEYSSSGAGRDDGKNKGEMALIYFRTERFKKMDSGHFWLSKTPDVPGSVGWDAALPRIVCWVRLQDRSSGKSFCFVNTHFDHRGKQARHESAKLMVSKLSELANKQSLILTGDFNSRPDGAPIQALLSTPVLRDTIQLSQTDPLGPTSTINGFKAIVPGGRIDYIFVTEPFKVLNHITIDKQVDGRFPSDHLPVWTTLKFE